MSSESLLFKTESILSLWQQFCEVHHEILMLTAREYSELLSSEIDALEKTIEEKNILLSRTDKLDKERHKLINSLNEHFPEEEHVVSVSDLIMVLEKNEETKNLAGVLSKQNDLLISLINDIRLQNKKNQHFLIKAIDSIKLLKDEMSGNKSYNSYGPKGAASKLSVRP